MSVPRIVPPDEARAYGNGSLTTGRTTFRDLAHTATVLGEEVATLRAKVAEQEAGSVIDKDAVREVLQKLTGRIEGRWFSEGDLGIEQATNRICGLQRSPRNIEDLALTVTCRYCGRTAGNQCHEYRRQDYGKAHPSRIRDALAEAKP
jgi:hypothetical protein